MFPEMFRELLKHMQARNVHMCSRKSLSKVPSGWVWGNSIGLATDWGDSANPCPQLRVLVSLNILPPHNLFLGQPIHSLMVGANRLFRALRPHGMCSAAILVASSASPEQEFVRGSPHASEMAPLTGSVGLAFEDGRHHWTFSAETPSGKRACVGEPCQEHEWRDAPQVLEKLLGEMFREQPSDALSWLHEASPSPGARGRLGVVGTERLQ